MNIQRLNHRNTIRGNAQIIHSRLLKLKLLNNQKSDSQNTPMKSIFYPQENQTLWEKLESHQHALKLIYLNTSYNPSQRILCWVNTYHKNHQTRAHAIRRTWGKRCDLLLFMSDIEDSNLPSIQIKAPPTHIDLWEKHQKTISYIYQHFGDLFDWFLKADDDTFVFLENARSYLQSTQIQSISSSTPVLLGHRMSLQSFAWNAMFREAKGRQMSKEFWSSKRWYEKIFPKKLIYYTPGGSGYIMNSAFMKLATQTFHKPFCFPNDSVPDDFALAFCMKHYHNALILDTRDTKLRERFHQYSPKRIYFEKTKGRSSFWWNSDHISIGWKNGTECCSRESISFHYMNPYQMDIIEELFYS